MRALVIDGKFGLEHLRLVERPDPVPGPGQVVVRTTAASINFRDLLMVRGHYDPRQPLPLVPCSDGAGVVEATGPGVDRVAVGDRVVTCFAQGWLAGRQTREALRGTLGGPLDGTLAERLLLSQEGVVRAPAHLTDVEAATLPCAALTAWTALTGAGVGPGDVVLVEGTGGVSIFALQLARLFGARVIVTSSKPEKLERARALGAWETIDHAALPAWGKRARELTGGRGVDCVIEVGGRDTLPQAVACLRPGGTIALIGILSGTKAEVDLIPLLMQGLRVQGVLVGHREAFEAMNRALEAHAVRPVVDDVFPWTEARAALEAMSRAAHFGKLALEFPGG